MASVDKRWVWVADNGYTLYSYKKGLNRPPISALIDCFSNEHFNMNDILVVLVNLIGFRE